jgi:hypothetical protein
MKQIFIKGSIVAILALAALIVAPKTHAYYVSINAYANAHNPNFQNSTGNGEVYDTFANGGGIYNTTMVVPSFGRGYGYQIDPYGDGSYGYGLNTSSYLLGNTYGGYGQNSYGYGSNSYGSYGLNSGYSSPGYYNNSYSGYNSYPSYAGSSYDSYSNGYDSGYNSGYGSYGYGSPSYSSY